jgi:hypothetical protein
MIIKDLEVILKEDIPGKAKETFKNMLNEQVFFDDDGKCRVGLLYGLADSAFVVITEDAYNFIPLWQNLNLL